MDTEKRHDTSSCRPGKTARCCQPSYAQKSKPCGTPRTRNPHSLPLQPAPPGTPTAHEKFCLVLLCSQPDTVHRHPLRKTRTSTPLIKASDTGRSPQRAITPAIADCRYRRPLLSRLHGSYKYTRISRFCQSSSQFCRPRAVIFLFENQTPDTCPSYSCAALKEQRPAARCAGNPSAPFPAYTAESERLRPPLDQTRSR